MDKPFDVHGWNYTLDDLAKLLITRNDVGLASYLVTGGGKAFGLDLCRQIVSSPRMQVPGWMILNRQSKREDVVRVIESCPRVIARSSTKEEDWLDPRSGVEESKSYPRSFALKEVDGWLASDQSLILQEYVWGCGCVIDIGYSELLERPVARVACGNRSITGDGHIWTSATWDHEARSAIYDLQSGEVLVGHSLKFKHDWADPFPQIIRSLVEGLTRLSINFGVQFEVIVDADHPNHLAELVQVRPTPGNIRGMCSKPEATGVLFASTASVNKAGTAKGDLLVIDRIGNMHSSDCDDLARQCEGIGGPWADNYRDRPDLSGKVLFWRYEDLKYNSAQRVCGAALCGAEGQITEHCIFTNSGHQTYSPYSKHGHELGAWQKGKELGLQFGRLDHDAMYNLYLRARKEPINLQLVSDGFVGQIYLQN